MSAERVTIAEFVERCKALLDNPEQCKCSKCSGQLFAGHGLAGGGMGPYVLCLDCGELVLKGIEDGGEGECFHT
jgi:hypothetical protein